MAILTSNLNLILHVRVDLAVAHCVLAGVTIYAGHCLFMVNVGNQLPNESIVAQRFIVEATPDKGSPILGAFHLAVVIQTHSCAAVVARSATIIGNSVSQGMSRRMTHFIPFDSGVAPYVAAIFAVGRVACRATFHPSHFFPVPRAPQVARGAEFSEMAF